MGQGREKFEMTRKEKKAYIKKMKALEKRLNEGERLTFLEMSRLERYMKQRTDKFWNTIFMLMAFSFILCGFLLCIGTVIVLIEI